MLLITETYDFFFLLKSHFVTATLQDLQNRLQIFELYILLPTKLGKMTQRLILETYFNCTLF